MHPEEGGILQIMMAAVLCSSETIVPVQPCIGTGLDEMGRDGKMIVDQDSLSVQVLHRTVLFLNSRKWIVRCSVLRTGF